MLWTDQNSDQNCFNRVAKIDSAQTRRRICNYTVKRPILKSSLMRQIEPLEYISTLLKRSIPKKPRYSIYELSRVMRNFMVNLKLLFLFVLKILQIGFFICQNYKLKIYFWGALSSLLYSCVFFFILHGWFWLAVIGVLGLEIRLSLWLREAFSSPPPPSQQ
jgi:hypothetical protein